MRERDRERERLLGRYQITLSETHCSLVHVDLPLGEVPHLLERVDGDEDGADVGEDPVVQEALAEVLHDGGLLDTEKGGQG